MRRRPGPHGVFAIGLGRQVSEMYAAQRGEGIVGTMTVTGGSCSRTGCSSTGLFTADAGVPVGVWARTRGSLPEGSTVRGHWFARSGQFYPVGYRVRAWLLPVGLLGWFTVLTLAYGVPAAGARRRRSRPA